MRFFVVDPSGRANVTPQSVTLRRDNWDDFGYRTMFHATCTLSSGDRVSLGAVKILQSGQDAGRPPLDDSFEELDTDYCSLGQDVDYYNALAELPTDFRTKYLKAMRDAAADRRIEEQFREEDGWSTSLLRFGQASNALEAGRRLLAGERKTTGRLSFEFEASTRHGNLRVPFRFDDAAELPGRCNVLIGYNGAGKTHLLAQLAVAASRYGLGKHQSTSARLTGEDTNFARVVAVSYSAFDTFATPSRGALGHAGEGKTEIFGYVYCGLRKFADGGLSDGTATSGEQALKSIDELETEFAVALHDAGDRREHRHFLAALDALAQEPSFGRIGVDLRNLSQGFGSHAAIEDFHRLSTGHKIVVNIVTQLAAHLRDRSLVLIDEPETHLHPPLMAALLKAIQLLLDAYDSFAIIATHSPVVLQEIPAKYVQVLERVGSQTSIRPPAVETFAESVGVITRQIFSLDSSATDYQGVLARLADGMTLEQIEGLFDHGLSGQGRALVLNYLNRSR